MRTVGWIVTVAMVVSTSAASAESLYGLESKAPRPGTVDIELVRSIEIHPRQENITRLCRAGWTVEGCTDFPVETLECRCERRDDKWVISASASLTVVTHLANSSQYAPALAHEQRHLDDVEGGLRAHLESLASWRFDTEAGCRRRAAFLSSSSHLRVVMNQLRVASNEKYGCSRHEEQ